MNQAVVRLVCIVDDVDPEDLSKAPNLSLDNQSRAFSQIQAQTERLLVYCDY